MAQPQFVPALTQRVLPQVRPVAITALQKQITPNELQEKGVNGGGAIKR
jgi:hypothetical protein